tara:strand:+ start:627 stop:1295 length:669 start_codon:yes stop_codon:yes gene_type:complete
MALNLGTGLGLSDINFSGAGGDGHAAAAALAPTAAIFGKIRQQRDPTAIPLAGLAAYGAEQRAAMAIDSRLEATKISADYAVKAEKKRRDMFKDAVKDSQPSGWENGLQIVETGVKVASLFSDRTTKNTIEEIDDALKTLRQLKPVSFYYNEDYSSNPERLHYGFVAQDYAKVMPQATYYDEPTGKLKIDTQELIGLLVRSIQQLETRITRMEAKAVLEGVK